MTQTHKLDTLKAWFDPIARGEIAFTVRRDDRGFQKGDTLELACREWENRSGAAVLVYCKGPALTKRISYILTGGQLGIEPGYVVLGLQDVEQVADEQ